MMEVQTLATQKQNRSMAGLAMEGIKHIVGRAHKQLQSMEDSGRACGEAVGCVTGIFTLPMQRLGCDLVLVFDSSW